MATCIVHFLAPLDDSDGRPRASETKQAHVAHKRLAATGGAIRAALEGE